MKYLNAIERWLGSSTLSWVCICGVAIQADLDWTTYLLLGVPLVNYTVKLEQIHAALTDKAPK